MLRAVFDTAVVSASSWLANHERISKANLKRQRLSTTHDDGQAEDAASANREQRTLSFPCIEFFKRVNILELASPTSTTEDINHQKQQVLLNLC